MKIELSLEEQKRLLNTIYIISKGRPRCTTAKTLTTMNYPGQWFIVCGSNDSTLDEYKKAWGDHVLVFDWLDEIQHTDTMDNFGFTKKASGACPVRNATQAISRARGELRHWQLDDDYSNFRVINTTIPRNVVATGEDFERRILSIARFGYVTGARNTGFAQFSECWPNQWYTHSPRVFNAHNLPSDDTFVPWVARLNDDVINALNIYKIPSSFALQFKTVAIDMKPTQTEQGGLTSIYKEDGTVRKVAYAVMASPVGVKLVRKFGRYHHRVNWRTVAPKIIKETWAKR